MDIDRLIEPVEILDWTYKAYHEPFIAEQDRLSHAVTISVGWQGGFRVNEYLDILASQVRPMDSLEGRPFLVITGVEIEKSQESTRRNQGTKLDDDEVLSGKTPEAKPSARKLRNVAILPEDPLSIPIQAQLKLLYAQGDGLLCGQITDRTVRRILDRVTGGFSWPHLLRGARDSFLAMAFSKDERKALIGWSAGSGRGRKVRDAEDRYAFLNWMTYADRLARLTETYWKRQTIRPEVQKWLDALRQQSQ